MEMTRFLGTTSSSNSFAKPIIKPASPFHYQFFFLFDRETWEIPERAYRPSCLTRNNNNSPAVHADWRSFRAKLVTGERSSTPPGTSNLKMNHKPVEEHHAHATNEDSWAHIIEEPEMGSLLIATEKLDGVNIFNGTVILILPIDSQFSAGIILNKPSSMTISTVIDAMDGPLYFGGPLDEKLVLISYKNNSNDDEVILSRSGFFEEVIEGLHYGSKKESLCCVDEMIKRNEIGVEDFRVFEGYSEWTNKLLRVEIRTGHWKVIVCSPNILSPLNSAESEHLILEPN
ncbi:hypothetical protein MKX03_015891 [Papaver bracteatum]|nr:hypothetical protein MKX03_015891 [Papaver bracteatum]